MRWEYIVKQVEDGYDVEIYQEECQKGIGTRPSPHPVVLNKGIDLDTLRVLLPQWRQLQNTGIYLAITPPIQRKDELANLLKELFGLNGTSSKLQEVITSSSLELSRI